MDSAPKDLAAFRALFDGIELALVGALALEVQGVKRRYKTMDADVALKCSVDDVLERLASSSWRRVAEHRWVGPAGTPVDVLPAGEVHLREGFVHFPGGSRMSLLGMQHLWSRRLAEVDLPLAAAPLACVFLLKVVSYRERPHARRKDLGDLTHIMDAFLPAEDDRRYLGPAADQGCYQEEASAWHLGHELAFVTPEEEEFLGEFVAETRRGEQLAEQLAQRAPAGWGSDLRVVATRFGILQHGLRAGLGG